MICCVCERPMGFKGTVLHHISYFPESKIRVHKQCHFLIHNTDNYPYLKPTKEDINKFYSGIENPKKMIRPEISEYNYNQVQILTNSVGQPFVVSLRLFLDIYEKLLRSRKWSY